MVLTFILALTLTWALTRADGICSLVVIRRVLRDVFRRRPLLIETRKARERQAEGEPWCADGLPLVCWGWGWRRLGAGVGGHVEARRPLWLWFERMKCLLSGNEECAED